MGQGHADVVPAAAEDGVDRIAGRALEGAAGEATVGFHVTDCRLDGTAAAQVAPERGGHAATLPGDEDLGCLYAVTTRAAIDEGARGARGAGARQDLDLFQRLAQGVAVPGIAGHRAHADDAALLVRGRHRDLGAKLVTDPRLALGMQSTAGSCGA